MAFEKLLAFTKKVSDLADQPTGTPAEIKAQFDAAPEELRGYFNQLIDDLKSLNLTDEKPTWINLTLQSGVKSYSANTTPQYCKIGNIVFIRGAVTNITGVDAVIATLPVNFRPISIGHSYAQPSSYTSGINIFSRLLIGLDGVIKLERTSNGIYDSNYWFPIDTSFVAG